MNTFAHLRHQMVMLEGKTITLTRRQYQALARLVQHAGEVVPRAAFLRQILGA
jgi:DNA-binding response OmpR family regulator